jgi:chromosome segregation ATPase
MSAAARPQTAGSLGKKGAAAAADDDTTLRDRLALMETDRKSFFESSQGELRRNKEEIQRLRNENNELKMTIAAAKRGGGHVIEKELVQLDQSIHTLTLKLDKLRHLGDTKREEIERLQAKLGEIKTESEPLLTEDSFITRRIRMLENRLDKSLIKYNEALAIKKTYEQIVHRLREERVGFDNQLAAIERTLTAKDNDYQELLKMSHDANHAKELAKKELQDFKAAFDDERKAKDRELAERKLYVQNKVDQTQKLEKREKALRQKEADEARSKLEEEANAGGGKNRGNGNALLSQRSSTDVLSPEDEERLFKYETAYKTIRDATGITDVNDLLYKYVHQEETHRNLEQMIREAQSRIDQLNVEKSELTAKLDDLRYSGSGQLGSRRIVEEFEIHLQEAGHTREANGERYEHLAKLLIDLKAGVEHLVEKLAAFRPEMTPPPVSDETVVDVLKLLEQKLVSLADEVVPTDAAEDALVTTATELPQHNRRVRLMGDEDEGDDGAPDPADDQEDDAVLKRDQVKKISANSVQRETKKLRRKKPSSAK